VPVWAIIRGTNNHAAASTRLWAGETVILVAVILAGPPS